jgi:hypothetical protein
MKSVKFKTRLLHGRGDLPVTRHRNFLLQPRYGTAAKGVHGRAQPVSVQF